MNAEQYRRVMKIFEGAIAEPEERQAAFVEQACGQDVTVRDWVLRLLSEDRKTSGVFSEEDIGIDSDALQVALAGADGAVCGEPESDALCEDEVGGLGVDTIGPYRVVRKVAEGGMGVVYEAEQLNPKRTVALKLIRESWFTPEVRRRFEHEVRILGQLNHPGIAHIYEAATTELAGRSVPYFAMEFVRGDSLIKHAEKRGLSTDRRLELMVEICGAVTHAHQKGVIHRDLKPANIMVTDDGRVKILDFGVARAIDSDVHAMTIQTHAGQLIGTLPYMSPEQVRGVPSDLDTRSDIYALGVVCFELLCGQLPHDVRNRSIPHAARIICDQEPTLLGSLDRQLRGDLETIVSKALSREREHRYQSAADFGADIARHLKDEPIEARPSTMFDQFTRFARRNRAAAAGIVIAMAALIVATGATSYGLMQARSQRDAALAAQEREQTQRLEAQRQATIVQAVNRFHSEEVLGAVRPDSLGIDATVREALEVAASRLEGRFADEPIVEAAVRHSVGSTYIELGQYELAQPHLERALALRDQHLGTDAVQTIECLNDLGVMLKQWGRYEEACGLLRDALERRRKVFEPDDERVLESMNNLAACLDMQGETDEAAQLYAETYDKCLSVLGESHMGTLTVAGNLAVVYSRQGRHEEALKIQQRVLEVERETLGEDHTHTILRMNNLAISFMKQGRFEESEALFREAIARRRRVLGDDHPYTIWTSHFLGRLFHRQGKLSEAERHLQEVLQKAQETLPPDHWYLGAFLTRHGEVLADLGRMEEAEASLVAGARQLIDTLGVAHKTAQGSIKHLVDFYERSGRVEQATSWREQLDSQSK